MSEDQKRKQDELISKFADFRRLADAPFDDAEVMRPTPIIDTAAPELLPCPFCGGEPERFTIEDEDEPDNFGGDVVCCTNCQASSHVEFGRKENLVSCWNRRSDLATVTAERDAALAQVGALREALDDVRTHADAWRYAFRVCQDAEDRDEDKKYWAHESSTLTNMCSALDDPTTASAARDAKLRAEAMEEAAGIADALGDNISGQDRYVAGWIDGCNAVAGAIRAAKEVNL